MLLVIIFATVGLTYVALSDTSITPAALREAIAAWGPWGPLLFIALVSARPIVLFPSTPLFIAAGLAFGPIWGTVLATIGATIAGIVTFLMARSLGREFVQSNIPESLRRLQGDKWGTGLVFFLNLVPVVPLTAVNYGAGLSTMALESYTLGVVSGITPRILAFAVFGDSLLTLGSTQFWIALAVLLLMVLVPLRLRRRWRRQ
jgi:uncharacterized membrane protein YdjX (TVP38/TMEM64 family)